MKFSDIKDFLDQKAALYEQPEFIKTDPVQIPHLFKKKEDREIAGFLTATISWGNRKMILNNAYKLINLLGNTPFDFVMNHTSSNLEKLSDFKHRTFNGTDLKYFIKALNYIYTYKKGLEVFFTPDSDNESVQKSIHEFKKMFFSLKNFPHRTQKHISDPLKGSPAKRINMFLRWMVRSDKRGVDLGIWKNIKPSQLSCPLDVHSATVARCIGILSRKQNDARALKELDSKLRSFDSVDPVKYDFALFGLGVFEKFSKIKSF